MVIPTIAWRFFLGIGFGVGLLAGMPGLAVPSFAAKDPQALSREIEEERRRLEALEEQIREKRQQVREVEHRKGSVLKTLESLDRRLLKKRREYRRITADLKQRDEELAAITADLEKLRTDLTALQRSLVNRLRRLYMEGRASYVRMLLSSESFSDFQRRIDYLSALAKRERHLLEAFHAQSRELEAMLARQAEKREELLAVRRQTEKAIRDMKAVHREKQVLLASLEKEKDLHEQAVNALRESAKRVDALLKELSARRRLAEKRAQRRMRRPVPKGALMWPAEGRVVSTFGRQKHPTFDTFVTKKGIEIEVAEGSPIRAVSSGKVVYADWLKGYGLVVILDHANGFFSLYAHASKLLVKEGQTVNMGDLIGETGETGLTKGRRLYFELRKGTQPVDPLKWLVKRP